MFRGRSRHTLDEKGRLAIPARFKDVLDKRGESCLIVTNYDQCLWAFALSDWMTIEEQATKFMLFDEAGNDCLGYFFSGAAECPLKQGRITLPPDLREVAGLIDSKEVSLVGKLRRFEIWEKGRWEREFPRIAESFASSRHALSGFGF